MNANAKAARDIRQRCTPSIGSGFRCKASILSELVRQFQGRSVLCTQTSGKGSTVGSRFSIRTSGGTRNAARVSKTQQPPALVGHLAISIVPLCTSCVPRWFGRLGPESAGCPDRQGKFLPVSHAGKFGHQSLTPRTPGEIQVFCVCVQPTQRHDTTKV